MPQLSGDRPPQGCELVVIAHGCQKGRKHWNGPGNLTHLAHTALRGEGKHKCEKPLDLMLDLVSWFSDPGEVVLDPFAGSGTTAVACAILEREFLGAEADPTWHAKATARITSKLGERDSERLERWRASQIKAKEDATRRAKHTAKIRAKLEAER